MGCAEPLPGRRLGLPDPGCREPGAGDHGACRPLRRSAEEQEAHVKKLSNERDLLIAELSELLWVERRLAFDVLKDVIGAVHDSELRKLFETHLEETREHVTRVEQAFRELGIEPSSALSPGFSGLIEQHDTVAKKIVDSAVEDRWHATAGIAAEHFELALYAALPDDIRDALSANSDDEDAARKKLGAWLHDRH